MIITVLRGKIASQGGGGKRGRDSRIMSINGITDLAGSNGITFLILLTLSFFRDRYFWQICPFVQFGSAWRLSTGHDFFLVIFFFLKV